MADNETKILICDDSILARKSLKEILNGFNYEDIVEVADGQTVIDTYKILKPDIVFLDIVMPVKDGITAVKEIVQFDPKACIIMVSSVGTQTHLKEAIKSGAKDFIQKPVDPEQLKQILNHCIGE